MNSLVLLPLFFAAAFAGTLVHQHQPAAHYAAAAVPVSVPAVAVSRHDVAVTRTQHHAQDGYTGTYDYGYAEPNGAKREIRHPDGTVTGSYSHPLPDGRILTNNYVADEDGFRSSLAPTADKDFASRVKAAYTVEAPVLQQTVEQVAVPQPPIQVTKTVNYAAPVVAPAPVPVPVPVAVAPAPAPVIAQEVVRQAAPETAVYYSEAAPAPSAVVNSYVPAPAPAPAASYVSYAAPAAPVYAGYRQVAAPAYSSFNYGIPAVARFGGYRFARRYW